MSSKEYEHDSEHDLHKRQHQDAEAAGIPALSNVDVNIPNDIHELIADVPLAGVRRVETVQAVWTKKSRWILFVA